MSREGYAKVEKKFELKENDVLRSG